MKGSGKGKFRNRLILYQGQQLVAARKNLISVQHPNVAERRPHENDRIRMEHGISLQSTQTFADHDLPPPIETFDELPFPDWIIHRLRRTFKEPMPIQVQAWSAALHGFDTIGIAETGCGKTLSYALPMLMHIIAQPELLPSDGPIGLVLVPTRHLCSQITDTINAWAGDSGDPSLKCFNADSWVDDDIENLARCCMLVATPERLLGLPLALLRATCVVLDEADELCAGGFQDQICSIVKSMRPDRQVLFFSATWRDEVEEFAQKIMDANPIIIQVGDTKLAGCRHICQTFARVGDAQKLNLLVEKVNKIKPLLSSEYKAIVFVNKKDMLDPVLGAIRTECGILSAESYGDRSSRKQLDSILSSFRCRGGDCHLLVATQVLGRGLDIPEIRLVLNFDLPVRLPDYVHRIGRAGRGVQEGFSWTLLEKHDLAKARELVSLLEASKQLVPQFILDARRRWKEYKQYLDEYLEEQRMAVNEKVCMERQGCDSVAVSSQAKRSTSALDTTQVGADRQEVERCFDDATRCWYWHDHRQNRSYWEIHENETPPEIILTKLPPAAESTASAPRNNMIGGQQELERCFDDSTGRWYWHHHELSCTHWEVHENVLPLEISKMMLPPAEVISTNIVVSDSTSDGKELQRCFDDATGRWYWHDYKSNCSYWEVEENVPPSGRSKARASTQGRLAETVTLASDELRQPIQNNEHTTLRATRHSPQAWCNSCEEIALEDHQHTLKHTPLVARNIRQPDSSCDIGAEVLPTLYDDKSSANIIFEVGMDVLAQWGSEWHPGKIQVLLPDGKFQILWDGDVPSISNVSPKHIRSAQQSSARTVSLVRNSTSCESNSF